MERTYIRNIAENVGTEVLIKGSVDTIRNQSKIIFLLIRDVSGLVQCVVLKDCPDFAVAKSLNDETVVALTGLVKAEKQAPGGYEIETRSIEVLSKAEPELPIPVNTKKGGEETNANARFDYRFIDIRKPEKTKIFKVWTELERGLRNYWDQAGYLQVYAPSFMSTSSESGAEVFEVKYFDRKAYLAQSPQFYKQMAISAGLDRVFIVGPVFRAEPSFTTRHLTEFTGWDFEIGFVESHHTVMDEEEKMIVSAFTELKKKMPELDIEIPKRPFPRIPLLEAKQKLKAAGVASDKPDDMSPEEERKIAEIVKQETGSDFVFLIDYPISVRPFYHMRHTDNPGLTKSADLIYRGIEITTLAQREHRYDILVQQAQEKKMDLKSLESYLSFFRFGCPPHGGGGIGPSRLIMKILNYENVREVTYLPRDVNRLTP